MGRDYSTSVWSSPRFSLPAVFLLYLFITIPAITRYPAPWVDEGWIGEVAAQIAHGHPPGNPSHGELYRYNDRIYWMPPLYFYLLGSWFSLTGVTLIAGRIFNVLVGGVTTLLLSGLVRRRFGAAAGVVAAMIFAVDTFAWKAHRTIRFESLLALFAVLMARLLYEALRRERSGERAAFSWAATGLAAGLLLNTHPLGALFVAAGVIEILRAGGVSMFRRKGPWITALVALAAILPYAIYCLGDSAAGFRNLIGQNSFHVDVGQGKGPVWLREWVRYASFFPSPWRLPSAAALAVIIGLAFRRRRDPVVGLCLTFILVPLLGMMFLPNKTLLYLVPVLPFAAALAGAIWRVKNRAGMAARIAAALLVLSGLVVDAGLLWKNRGCDPVGVMNEIRSRLRPDDRVAGTFVTWWAAQPRPFHEFSRGATPDAVDAFRPDVIILGDRQWEQERNGRFAALDQVFRERFEADHVPGEALPDPCLGPVTLHRVSGPSPPSR